MKPSYIDHEWLLYLNFNTERERSIFEGSLRNAINEYYYQKLISGGSQKVKKEDMKSPISGQLYLFLSEAKNIPVGALRRELSSNSDASKINVNVQVEFIGPKSMENLFNSMYIEESLLADMNSNLTDAKILASFPANRNFIWRTEDNPAGIKNDMGRLVLPPKSNTLIEFTLFADATIKGRPAHLEFGKGRYASYNIK